MIVYTTTRVLLVNTLLPSSSRTHTHSLTRSFFNRFVERFPQPNINHLSSSSSSSPRASSMASLIISSFMSIISDCFSNSIIIFWIWGSLSWRYQNTQSLSIYLQQAKMGSSTQCSSSGTGILQGINEVFKNKQQITLPFTCTHKQGACLISDHFFSLKTFLSYFQPLCQEK